MEIAHVYLLPLDQRNVRRNPKAKLPKPFTGRLSVEGGAFTLEAERLIPREHEIAFTLVGKDEFGKFRLEGIAHLSDHGFFVAPKCPLIYPDYDRSDYEEFATIRIDTAKCSKAGHFCKISGVWKQIGDDEWTFDGSLRKSM
jgi:hypothetical protein